MSSSIVLDPPPSVEIFNVIISLYPHKACGFDSISAAFLQLGNNVLAPVRSFYFSCAFQLEVIPNYFKTAKVIPIFKSGNKNLVSNYYLISLLTTLSKVLEKLIKDRLVKFFDKHNIWYECQYGCREKHSVSHALLHVSWLCYDSIQNKLHTAMLFKCSWTYAKPLIQFHTKFCSMNFTIAEFEALQ